MMERSILIIEDDEKMSRVLELILSQDGHRVQSVSSGVKGIDMLRQHSASGGFDLVITDLQMPKMTGLQVLERIREEFPETPVLILTGFGTVKTAVEAMKKGAFDYITKPIDNDELKLVVRRALEVRRLYLHHQQINQDLRKRFGLDNIIGESEAMEHLKKMVRDVASTDYTVLITGESGTGKELLARAIHYGSRRSQAPMVTINCGAIPESLLESELFGYEKGAFTDAKQAKPGRLKIADGGTVFLDELAELSPMTQVKLLRVLQEKEIEPLGSTQSVKVDIRIVAATNKDLFEQVKKGLFREDLFYRVNVFPIQIPPLRDRGEDFELLLNYFTRRYNLEIGKQIRGFSPAALSILRSYPWPGNVRELQNLVERMMIVCKKDRVEAEDLPLSFSQPAGNGGTPASNGESSTKTNGAVIQGTGSGSPDLSTDGLEALDRIEERMIREALEKTSGNVAEAARVLKITRNTLRYRMQKYGLDRPK